MQRAKEFGVDEPRSMRQSRPPRRLDDGAPPAHPATPRDAYRIVYYETLDRLVASIGSRYAQGDHQLLVQAERALLTGDAADVACAAASFGLGPERTCLHVQMFHDICKQRDIKLDSLPEVISALQDDNIRGLLPDCVALVKLLLTAPATSCTAERSFSVLRRLKNWLRSTISQERLSQAAILASYPEKVDALDIDREMREFAAQTAQRVNTFGRW